MKEPCNDYLDEIRMLTDYDPNPQQRCLDSALSIVRLQPCLANVDQERLRRYLKEVDGHTYWKPKHFLDMGFSQAFVNGCTRDHVSSDDDAMHQVIDHHRLTQAVQSGQISDREAIDIMTNPADFRFKKEHVVAVHDLDLLQQLALALGTPLSDKTGRGWRASEIATGILQYLDSPTLPPAPVSPAKPKRITRTRKRVRDSQRRAVHDWTDEIAKRWAEAGRELKLDECQQLIDVVWSDYRPGAKGPLARAGHGSSRARFASGMREIRLPRWARRPIDVLYMTAHSLEIFTPLNGPRFARLLLELCARYLRLPKAELRAAGVHQKPRRVRFAAPSEVPQPKSQAWKRWNQRLLEIRAELRDHLGNEPAS